MNVTATDFGPEVDELDEAKLTNYQGWRTSFFDEKLNTLIEEALLEQDPVKQKALYEGIQVYMEQIVMSMHPFSEVTDTAAYQADIEGMIVSPWLSRFEGVTKTR